VNTPRGILAALAALLAGCAAIFGLPLLVFGGQALACDAPIRVVSEGTPIGGFDQWNPIQVTHATTVVAVGKQAAIPPRGWVAH
jgi:hypothetical protein